jgi:uncharacterized protein YceH (UPF0502 family)
MSSEPESAVPGPAPAWPVLDMQERRVLGVLVEKQKTSKTADAYPLSLNALVTGCNQKSNRDPVLNMTEDEAEEALMRCQRKGLAIKITGMGRVVRWRHSLYEAWHVDKVDLALLAELLLRGPQTEGELRTRASRMEPIDDLDALRAALRPLVERKLVVYLTPEERRGAVLTHGFHDPRELEHLRAVSSAQPAPPAVSAPLPVHAPVPAAAPPRVDERVPALESGLAEARTELKAAREKIAALEQALSEVRGGLSKLAQDLQSLKQGLGV